MFAEDRVLVSVINRQRDWQLAQDEHWYRIPVERLGRAFTYDYVAFFFSRAFGDLNGGVHFFALVRGLELAYRRDLLPAEAAHPRADAVYYRVALGEMFPKVPPILNPRGRRISFVFTTWDRFSTAYTISELYSKSAYYVDRVYYAL
jgi:hypothetical protein